MGTVPIGTGELRKIHSRVVWMLRPVERSITVSAPQRIAHTILSTSSSTEEVTAELPILALILVRKLRPMIIGSSSPWLMLQGMIARPRDHPLQHQPRRTRADDHRPQFSHQDQRQYRQLRGHLLGRG